jgi:ATP-dependent metalloprotease
MVCFGYILCCAKSFSVYGLRDAAFPPAAQVRRFGYSDVVGRVSYPEEESEKLSPQTRATIEAEIRRLIEEAQDRAMALLTSKRAELERLSAALITYETLDQQEVLKIVAGEKLDRNPI